MAHSQFRVSVLLDIQVLFCFCFLFYATLGYGLKVQERAKPWHFQSKHAERYGSIWLVEYRKHCKFLINQIAWGDCHVLFDMVKSLWIFFFKIPIWAWLIFCLNTPSGHEIQNFNMLQQNTDTKANVTWASIQDYLFAMKNCVNFMESKSNTRTSLSTIRKKTVCGSNKHAFVTFSGQHPGN